MYASGYRDGYQQALLDVEEDMEYEADEHDALGESTIMRATTNVLRGLRDQTPL